MHAVSDNLLSSGRVGQAHIVAPAGRDVTRRQRDVDVFERAIETLRRVQIRRLGVHDRPTTPSAQRSVGRVGAVGAMPLRVRGRLWIVSSTDVI